MADTSKSKQWDMRSMTDRWDGYVSSIDKTNVAENILVQGSQNVYKKLSGLMATRPGQKRLGVANDTASAVSSEFVWNTSWGATYIMVVADSKLSVVIDNVWYDLLTSQTRTRWVFDKWWDNTEKKDRVIMVNGSDDLLHWSGGFATVLSSTVNTITKTGSTSWQQAGFTTTSGEKTVVIGGTTFTYTGGETTTTLTGVTPDASGIVVGATALQAVQTSSNKPAADFANDFIKIINNQLYVGSYTSRLIYISNSTDFDDFTVPTPRAPGDPELLTLDGTGKGIGVRQGKAHIGFGSGSWAVITFNDITVGTDLTQQTKVDVKPVALLQAPLAHEFIDSVGDNLIYLAQDQQVRSFGDFNNLFATGYPSYSQEMATELAAEDFTGGGLRCIGEFIYVTAPISGITYLKQERTYVDEGGNIVAERLWHSPFVWNATRIDQINGVVISFSNANPQIYQVWETNQWYDDSPSDEPLPYRCVMALGYRGGQRRQGLWSFDKQYTEGYIYPGTTLNLLMNYNFQGASNAIDAIVNNETQPAHTFSQAIPSLGESSLGEDPLGDITTSEDEQTSLPKFRVINSLPIINCFEWQPVYSSDEVNAQWEILATADNAEVEREQVPTFIINKVR